MKTVAFLLFESFESLDVYGPLSVFACSKASSHYHVCTVSQHAGPVKSTQGIYTIAEHDFSSCPPPDIDILVVPGEQTRFCVLSCSALPVKSVCGLLQVGYVG